MIGRRKLMLAGSGLLAAPALLRSTHAANAPLQIAGLYSLSGVFANVGTLMNQGSKLAIDFYKQADSHPLDYVLLDDQGDSGRAVRIVKEAMGKGVKHIVGCTNSAIGLAAAKAVQAGGGIYVNMAGADEVTGSECNRATFRWPVATYSAARATVAPLLKRYPSAKRWYTITGQYVFGDGLLNNTKAALKEMGAQHVGNSYHSLTEREFSGYITAAMATQPDVLAICNFGNQTLDVIRQAVSFGMKRNTKILAMWSTGLDQAQALGANTLQGVFFGVNYWHTIDSPGNKVLTAVVEQKMQQVPNYLLADGWVVVQLLVEAANKAKSTDVNAMIHAMEGMTYQGPTGTETVRAADHQVVKPYYLMEGKKPSEMKDKYDFATLLAATTTLPPADQTGCHMS